MKGLAASLTDYSDPRSLGFRLRARRASALIELIRSAAATGRKVDILDVGGVRTYWNILPDGFIADHVRRIVLFNLEPPGETPAGETIFECVTGDACDLPFGDNEFDLVHSNSVIEHVGGWARMKAFAGELRRVAPKYFVQTPSFWFPVEPHYVMPFIHWLPGPMKAAAFRWVGTPRGGRSRSMDDAMSRVEAAPVLLDLASFQALFPDGRMRRERILLLTKSLIAIRR